MRMRHVARMVGLACTFALAAQGRAASNIWYFNTSTTGGQNPLWSLERIGVFRNSVGYSYYFSDLILPNISAINNVSNVTVLTPGLTTRDGAAFLRDSYLNTGLSSPGVGNGSSFTAADHWTRISFDAPVVNSDGPDLLVVSLFPLWAADVASPYIISTSAGHSHVGETTYESSGSATPSITQYMYTSSVTTSSDLLSKSVTNAGSLVNHNYILQTLDLSSMGVGAGQSVQELYVQDWSGNGNGFSPSLIAGFPTVPEPGIATLGAGISLMALWRRRKSR